MTNNNNKNQQAQATHEKQSQAEQSKSSNMNSTSSGAMTPQEAGHLGGTARHACRGFQCQEEEKRNK